MSNKDQQKTVESDWRLEIHDVIHNSLHYYNGELVSISHKLITEFIEELLHSYTEQREQAVRTEGFIDGAHATAIQQKEIIMCEIERLEKEVKPTHAEENGYGCAIDDMKKVLFNL